jgi:hypothetical protein
VSTKAPFPPSPPPPFNARQCFSQYSPASRRIHPYAQDEVVLRTLQARYLNGKSDRSEKVAYNNKDNNERNTRTYGLACTCNYKYLFKFDGRMIRRAARRILISILNTKCWTKEEGRYVICPCMLTRYLRGTHHNVRNVHNIHIDTARQGKRGG